MDLVIETPRLVLREMSGTDLDFVASMLAHPQVMRYFPACCSRAEAEAWVRRQEARYARDGYGYWLLIEKASERPVGQVGLMTIEIDGIDEPGLGYLVHHPFWRRGFATEAAAATLDYTLRTLGKPRVVAPVRPENEPSIAVARKLGMKPGKTAMFAGFEHVIFTADRADCNNAPRDSSTS